MLTVRGEAFDTHYMKKLALSILLLFQVLPILAEDYQYDYFADKQSDKEKYVPFSDYIPRVRKHYYTTPLYLEDYYLLYGMKQHYNENSLRNNILMLKTALQCNFRYPSEALCKLESDEEYYKYRNLMFMHVNILIMRSYLKIAVRYDTREIRFFDRVYGEEISESLKIAAELYEEAVPYWLEARRYAKRASSVKRTLDLGTIETERYRIKTGDLDYGRIIKGYIQNTEKKRKKLASMMAQNSN